MSEPVTPAGKGMTASEAERFLLWLRAEAAASLYRLRTTPPRSIR